jgi:hypothetical protein
MSRQTGWVSRSFLPALLFIAGCQSVPTRPPVVLTGDPLVDNKAQLAAAKPKDRVLWEYKISAAAMHRGQWDEARTQLDAALGEAASNYGNVNSEAAKARGMFRNESDKPFVGEPYERVMANYYRSVLYWRDGEPDNARALFRTAQLIDSDAQDKTYAGDYVLLDYLDGFVSLKLGGDGSESLARAQAAAAKQGLAKPPPYEREANVLVFVEYGHGPKKYQGGEYGELLKFYTEKSREVMAELTVDGQTIKLPPYDDLNFQATTRGGRVMDAVLGNKAVFKQTTGTVGDVALMGAAVTAQNGRSRDANNAAIGLAAVGLLSKIASAATTPQADIRTWDNLPQYLSFGALKLAPGEHQATLRFLDASRHPLERFTQTFTISVPPPATGVNGRDQDVVVFRSELNN